MAAVIFLILGIVGILFCFVSMDIVSLAVSVGFLVAAYKFYKKIYEEIYDQERRY